MADQGLGCSRQAHVAVLLCIWVARLCIWVAPLGPWVAPLGPWVVLLVRLCFRHEASCLPAVEVACLPLAVVEELMLSSRIGHSRLADVYLMLCAGGCLFGMQQSGMRATAFRHATHTHT